MVDGAGTTERLGGDFGEAEVVDFTLVFELDHCFNGFLDWCFAVDSVAVVEVDVVDTESL